MDMQSVDSPATTPADAVELKRTDQATVRSGFLSGPIASSPAPARPARRPLRLPTDW